MALSLRIRWLAGAVFALSLANPAMADCVDEDTFVYPDGEIAFSERAVEALTSALKPPPPGWKTYGNTIRYAGTSACSTGERPRTVRRTRAEISTYLDVAKLGTNPEQIYRILLVGNRLTPDTTGKFVENIHLGTPSPNGAAGRLYNVTIRIAPMPGGRNANATAPIGPADLQLLRGMVDEAYIQSLMAGNVPALAEAKARKEARLAEINRVSNNNVNAASGARQGGNAQSSSPPSQPSPRPRPSGNPAGEIIRRLPGGLFR